MKPVTSVQERIMKTEELLVGQKNRLIEYTDNPYEFQELLNEIVYNAIHLGQLYIRAGADDEQE